MPALLYIAHLWHVEIEHPEEATELLECWRIGECSLSRTFAGEGQIPRRYTFSASGSRQNLPSSSTVSREVAPACMRLLRQCGYRPDRLQIAGSIHIWKVWAGFRRMNGMLANSNIPTAIYRSPSLGCPWVPAVFDDMLGPGRSGNK